MKKIESITIEDNEEYLRQISKEVDIKNDKELMNDISVLDEYCKENAVMAMAAVQLGIPKRMIYLKNTNLDIINKIQANTVSEEEKKYNEAKVLINPIITNREGLTDYWEACASCLDNFGRVLRPYKIELEYYDVEETRAVAAEFVEEDLGSFTHEYCTKLCIDLDHIVLDCSKFVLIN